MEDTIKANLGNLMKEAQKIQEKMLSAQKVLSDLIVIGEAGAGLVKVPMNGRHFTDHQKLYISDEVLKQGCKTGNWSMLRELLAAAWNDGVNKIEKASTRKISEIAANLELPPEFKVPLGNED